MPRHNNHEKKKGKKTPSVLSFENSFKKKFHRHFVPSIYVWSSFDRSFDHESFEHEYSSSFATFRASSTTLSEFKL